MNVQANVLILGKSGSGKSSLLNYLWGAALADAAAGRPVTPREKNGVVAIYRYPPIREGALTVSIDDSWGLEADSADHWVRLITAQAAERERSDNINEWYHTVIYCLSAKGARVEPFETDQVLSALRGAGHHVMFVLTKCDIASSSEKEGIRRVLEDAGVHPADIVEVTSVTQTLRGGVHKAAHGRDNVMQRIGINFARNLVGKIERRFADRARKVCNDWTAKVLQHHKQRVSLFTLRPTIMEEVRKFAEAEFRHALWSLRRWHEDKLHEAERVFIHFGSRFLELENVRHRWEQSKPAVVLGETLKWKTEDSIDHYVRTLLVPFYTVFESHRHERLLRKRLERVTTHLLMSLEGAKVSLPAPLPTEAVEA